MIEIYVNGKRSNWKNISNDYGTNYAEELKEFAKGCEPYTTITSEDGSIDIMVY